MSNTITITSAQNDALITLRACYVESDMGIPAMVEQVDQIFPKMPAGDVSKIRLWIEQSLEPYVEKSQLLPLPDLIKVIREQNKRNGKNKAMTEPSGSRGKQTERVPATTVPRPSKPPVPGSLAGGESKRDGSGVNNKTEAPKSKRAKQGEEGRAGSRAKNAGSEADYNPVVGAFRAGRCGDAPEAPLDEGQSTFVGDVTGGQNDLSVCVANMFSFIDKHGELIPVAPGPGKRGTYMVAACGTLNLTTESGQRLAMGYWNSDPDPARAKLKMPSEITWLKIPIRWINVGADLNLFDENPPVLTVDGDRGVYVCQCPDNDYLPYYQCSLGNFEEKPDYPGLDPLASSRPEWVDPIFWADVKDEATRWRQAGLPFRPPEPTTQPRALKRVIDLHSRLVASEAIVRYAKWEIRKDEEVIARLHVGERKRLAKKKGQRRAPTKSELEIEGRQRRVAANSRTVAEYSLAVESSLHELETAKKALAMSRSKAAKIRPAAMTSSEAGPSGSNSSAAGVRPSSSDALPAGEAGVSQPTPRSPTLQQTVGVGSMPARDLRAASVHSHTASSPGPPLPLFATQAATLAVSSDIIPLPSSSRAASLMPPPPARQPTAELQFNEYVREPSQETDDMDLPIGTPAPSKLPSIAPEASQSHSVDPSAFGANDEPVERLFQ